MKPQVGKIAPNFSSLNDEGTPINLSDFLGQSIILYFYPKADTPGCIKQACSFRDTYSFYEKNHIQVIGVSPDTVEDQAKFKEKYKLPFTLVADADRAICELYGVWGDHVFVKDDIEYPYTGVWRSCFVIDKNGTIKHVFDGVDPTTNSAQVIELFT